MDLTVLGNSSRYLAPLGAGTSYLLEAGEARIVLDCGNGTHLALAERLGTSRPSCVVVSHFHLDSMMDLLPVLFALPRGAPVLIPDGAQPRFTHLLYSLGMDSSWVESADIRAVGPGGSFLHGPVRLRFGEAHHGCEAVTVRGEAHGRALTYLADTGPHAGLADFARGSDLVVAHTLLLDREALGEAGATNLSAAAAGRVARDAHARRLALSHIPFYRDADESLKEARAAFDGEAFVLAEGKTYAV